MLFKKKDNFKKYKKDFLKKFDYINNTPSREKMTYNDYVHFVDDARINSIYFEKAMLEANWPEYTHRHFEHFGKDENNLGILASSYIWDSLNAMIGAMKYANLPFPDFPEELLTDFSMKNMQLTAEMLLAHLVDILENKKELIMVLPELKQVKLRISKIIAETTLEVVRKHNDKIYKANSVYNEELYNDVCNEYLYVDKDALANRGVGTLNLYLKNKDVPYTPDNWTLLIGIFTIFQKRFVHESFDYIYLKSFYDHLIITFNALYNRNE